ncbi:AraC family transcriptional regulator [Bradyrhizobium diazoefficiens]|nr:AraC family transcriptional regulator [Bradyrhizobium diazoefficiens]QQN62292.1 AraC family transcriptional regulator [Bradyrhizobium diazoefficiens]
MKPIKIVTPVPAHPDAPRQNLQGLAALASELAAEGVSAPDLFARTRVCAGQLENERARISRGERLAIYRNAKRLAKRSDIALLAGARQRISDYGICGYAMFSSRNFGDALLFLLDHIDLAGPVAQQISFHIEGGHAAVLRSHGLDTLGDLVPFVAEFWRSSMTSLFSRVLELPFPAKRMTFPFPAPVHWRSYGRLLNCPIEFGADHMEWHFGAEVLELPCPNANPITAKICQQLCDVVLTERPGESELLRKIRATCVSGPSPFPGAAEIARELGLSLRTLHRRLAEEGLSYQSIVDEMRRSLATELLENTQMSIDQVAERVGFADATSFRKAFKKWTDWSPSDVRHPERNRARAPLSPLHNSGAKTLQGCPLNVGP